MVTAQLADYPAVTKEFSITVRISRDCDSENLLTIPSTPFTNMEYTIGDPSMTQTWTADEYLVTVNSYLDCGTYSFEWWMNNQND